MARGDAIFGRVDVSLLMDARWRQLTAAGKVTYLTLYLTAVEHRRSILDTQYTPEALADRTGLDQRTYRKALQKCIELNLIMMTHDNRVYVPNAKENNEKLRWYDDGIFPAYGGDMGGIQGSEREIDRKIERKIDKQTERESEREQESLPPEAASPCLPKGQAQRQIKEPTPEEVKHWQELFPADNTPAKDIAMSCGKANMPKSKIFEEALKVMKPEDIKNQCAWVKAYQQLNNIDQPECAGILTNRLKEEGITA